MQIDAQFGEVLQMIRQSRYQALKAVNAELINLYWNVGRYVSQKVAQAQWGNKTVEALSDYLETAHPDIRGFDKRNVYRMRQMYESYAGSEIVVPVAPQLAPQLQDADSQGLTIVVPVAPQLAPQLPSPILEEDIRETILAKVSWTHHIMILGRCDTLEEREFYLKMSARESYSKRELERQINAGQFERVMLGKAHVPPSLKSAQEAHPELFKDTYVFDFLELPEGFKEDDLQAGLVARLKELMLEMGKDLLFVGENYKIVVGSSDFFIDLLFYHRGLQCLVALELKIDRFKPEHLGKLSFYLTALDRQVRRPNENPSIGILLCRDQDHTVVEYALSAMLSPTLISQYKVMLPDEQALRKRLKEVFWEGGQPA